MALRVLILGGTTEATALALALHGDARFAAILSFAGRTSAPRLPPVACRVGGFGGIAGLADYLRAEHIDAVLDATHPFAAQITRHAAAACARAGVAALRLDRPAWQAEAGDRWTMVADMTAAAGALGPLPRRVLLTIGQQDLGPFANYPWHDYIIRSVDPPVPHSLPARAMVITARGPFAEADEHALLQRHGVDILVTKNAGGSATIAKLAAARTLGVAVVMVRRPPAADIPTVADVPAALAWLLDQATSAARGV